MSYKDSLFECDWYRHPYFKDIAVSNNGRVMSYKGSSWKELKPSPDKQGYLRVGITERGSNVPYIHRLVAETYIPNPNDCREVNHKDGNKQNNHPDNLEWCSRSDNMTHAYNTGLKTQKGKSIRVVETGKTYRSINECAKDIGSYPGSIHRCLTGKKKTHHGLHFEEY